MAGQMEALSSERAELHPSSTQAPNKYCGFGQMALVFRQQLNFKIWNGQHKLISLDSDCFLATEQVCPQLCSSAGFQLPFSPIFLPNQNSWMRSTAREHGFHGFYMLHLLHVQHRISLLHKSVIQASISTSMVDSPSSMLRNCRSSLTFLAPPTTYHLPPTTYRHLPPTTYHHRHHQYY